MFCPKCGAELREDDKFCSACGAIMEQINEVEVRMGEVSMEKAGAGARFGSYLIDILILLVIIIPLSFAASLAGYVEGLLLLFIGMAIGIGYYVYFFGKGQTPGMMVVKIKLCRTDGTYPIGYTHGFLRYIGMLISGNIAFGLGFLWILIDKNKQGWHDKIADTYVVKINE
ncbi:MAG: RDD family protein [Candidatus Syntrophoarchaeum sp. GoM_oil]|nr:MAG: RDD family protein [Candidatus Syntrophoarchaeum sp. GoM_oil]